MRHACRSSGRWPPPSAARRGGQSLHLGVHAARCRPPCAPPPPPGAALGRRAAPRQPAEFGCSASSRARAAAASAATSASRARSPAEAIRAAARRASVVARPPAARLAGVPARLRAAAARPPPPPPPRAPSAAPPPPPRRRPGAPAARPRGLAGDGDGETESAFGLGERRRAPRRHRARATARLQRANLRGQLPVAFGLPRLAPQPASRPSSSRATVSSRASWPRRRQPELRLVAAAMQARDPGRLLQDPPAVLRLGGDQFGDLALAHQGRRVRAGGGVGEQQLHVARAHLAAVDAVGGALAAVDAADHLQHRRGR